MLWMCCFCVWHNVFMYVLCMNLSVFVWCMVCVWGQYIESIIPLCGYLYSRLEFSHSQVHVIMLCTHELRTLNAGFHKKEQWIYEICGRDIDDTLCCGCCYFSVVCDHHKTGSAAVHSVSRYTFQIFIKFLSSYWHFHCQYFQRKSFILW